MSQVISLQSTLLTPRHHQIVSSLLLLSSVIANSRQNQLSDHSSESQTDVRSAYLTANRSKRQTFTAHLQVTTTCFRRHQHLSTVQTFRRRSHNLGIKLTLARMLIGNKMGATLPCQNTCRHTLHTISSPQNERDAFKSAVKATTKGEASTRASPQSRSPLSSSGISGSRTSFLKAGLKV